MNEIIKILIAIIVLVFGIVLGNSLASKTKEELKSGQKWFKLIVIIFSILGFIGLIIGNDVLLFSCFFIAIVTSRSLREKKNIKSKNIKNKNKLKIKVILSSFFLCSCFLFCHSG